MARGRPAACPAPAELEAQGYRIGSIRIRELPIFDAGPDGELPTVYRLANELHVDTRDSVIESQLLFREGDPVSHRLFEETERNLRELRYIREPSVTAVGCHDGMADIEVTVREVWTTNPGFSFARSGGENSAGIKLQELNVLGLGKQLTFELSKDADRSFYTVHWRDPGVRDSRWVTDLALRESSDGQGWSAMAERPFYALDSRWSAGFALQQDETVDPVYRLGERVAGYNRQADFAEVRYGRSDGLLNGWSRRTTFGFRREHADFEVAPDEAAPAVMPDDRRLDYPFLRFEAVQDDFETTRNRDQIARTEDQQFGLHYALEVGWSTPALGADRDGLLLHAAASRGWRLGLDDTMFADAALTTRVEGGTPVDGLLSGSLRYYRPTGPSGVFFAGFSAGLRPGPRRRPRADDRRRHRPARLPAALPGRQCDCACDARAALLLEIPAVAARRRRRGRVLRHGPRLGRIAHGPEREPGPAQGRRIRPPPRHQPLGPRQRHTHRRRLSAGRWPFDRQRPVPGADEAQLLTALPGDNDRVTQADPPAHAPARDRDGIAAIASLLACPACRGDADARG